MGAYVKNLLAKWKLIAIVLAFTLNNVHGQFGLKQNRQETISFATGLGLVAGAYFLDKEVQRFSQNNINSSNDALFEIDRYYGDKEVTGLFLLGGYGLSWLMDNAQWRDTYEKAILSSVVTTIVVASMKEAFGRSRPYRGDGTHHFRPFQWDESRRSFPSGHASFTMTVSTVMAQHYDNIYWQSAWYGGALLVSGARIYHNKHWLSDVVAGSLIGYWIALKTIDMIDSKKATPLIGMAFKNGTSCITLSYSF